MNDFYVAFIGRSKKLAAEKRLVWDMTYNDLGLVEKTERWNLTNLCGMVPPPTLWLRDMGYDNKCLPVLNRFLERAGKISRSDGPMPANWQDFYKSVLLNELLVKRNKPSHALTNIGRQIRILATCAHETDPWALTSDIVQLAYNVALLMSDSGKLAANVAMTVRTIIDGLHLADQSPLAGFCVPFPTSEANAAEKQVQKIRKANNIYSTVDQRRSELAQRKAAGKLPGERAFWELVRIVFTEKPKTFSDAVRFCQIKVAIVTGFRMGENATIPVDWERWRDYVDTNGKPAGESGGISRSLMLRHFAEKQADDVGTRKSDSEIREQTIVLYETAQHVPQIFEEIVCESLMTAKRITQPMRNRLRHQTETGRLFPELDPNDLIPGWDLRNRCTGSIKFAKSPIPERLILAYRESFRLDALEQIRSQQIESLQRDGADVEVGKYLSRLRKNYGLTPRRATGEPYQDGQSVDSKDLYYKVGEVEDFMPRIAPTKMPDRASFTLQDGTQLYPHDLMFLLPINDRLESLDRGILDIARYFAVGRVSPSDMHWHLGGRPDNLFSRYGETEEDRNLSLNTHSLRHLQNGELFRLGVADTIITKRFNRRSVTQSYEYNHASLGEDLAYIDLPKNAERMGPRAQEVLRMIGAGRVAGTVVDEFHKIQRELGDDAAFDYLDAEADGLHVTPYGFCVNSFSMDPCPKHIECYNGCQHLCRTDVAEEQRNLERLGKRMQQVVDTIKSTPADQRSLGWSNQLKHADVRLRNIRKALATRPGQRPFPDGPDLFRSLDDKVGRTILDGPKIRRAE